MNMENMTANRADGVWSHSEEQGNRIREQAKGKARLFKEINFNQLASLQQLTSGLMPGVYLIAADTNIGKTSMLTSIAFDVCEQNPEVCVVYLSFDDDHWEVHNRLVAGTAEVPISEALICDFKTAEKRQKFLSGAKALNEHNRKRRLLIAEPDAIAEIGTGDNYFEQMLSGLQSFISEELKHAGQQHSHIILCIDNVSNLNSHNPHDPYDGSGSLAIRLQSIAKQHRISIVLTTESSDREGRAGKPRGSRTNSFAARMVYNLRDPKPIEIETYSSQLRPQVERLLMMEVLKNKASGVRKMAMPFAVEDSYGRVRSLQVLSEGHGAQLLQARSARPVQTSRKARSKDERYE